MHMQRTMSNFSVTVLTFGFKLKDFATEQLSARSASDRCGAPDNNVAQKKKYVGTKPHSRLIFKM